MVFFANGLAQTDTNFNGWTIYNGDHPISAKWGVHLEGQWRRHDSFLKWQQLLLRPGINYQMNSVLQLTLGYGFIKTHRYGDFPSQFPFPEHRLYEQAVFRHGAGSMRFSHRLRLEQRYIGVKQEQADGQAQQIGWRYQNRFRYSVKATIPLKRQSDWFWALYNEIKFNFGENKGPRAFDQNRAYAAIGRRLDRHNTLEVGYLNQYLAQRNGRIFENNHTLQLTWFCVVPFRKDR